MNNREAHISVADYGGDDARKARILAPEAHSFTPLLSEFAGDQWRKGSEGIYTQAWASGDGPDEAGFKIRVFATPASADNSLRALLPLVVEENCPFKVIANSALLELAYFNWPPGSPTGAFLTVYPPTEAAFNELSERLKGAANGIKAAPPASPTVAVGKTNPLTPENPWPGSRPYQPDEAAYFFGFEDEQAELSRRLGRAALTVLLGVEQSGKSSLLQAGLTDAFGHANMVPIYLRVKFGGAVHPVQQVRDAINRVLTERQIDGAPFGEGQTLRDYFHAQPQPWLDAEKKPVVPVLIFDQFEDVFAIDGENQAFVKPVDVFWTQIGNLIENRGRDSGKQLALPYSDPRNDRVAFKALICLRQDKLPKLQSRRGLIPSLAQNQFSLKPFRGQRAMQAVLGPGKNLFDAADAELLAEEIVRLVGNESPQSLDAAKVSVHPNEPLERLRVEPALLSFFCEQLNEARSRSGEAVITANLIEAESSRIFARFFHREEPIETPLPVETPKVEQKAPAEPEVIIVPAKTPEKVEALIVPEATTTIAAKAPEPKAVEPAPVVPQTAEVLPVELLKNIEQQKMAEPAVVVPELALERVETSPVKEPQTIPPVSPPELTVEQIPAVASPVVEIPQEIKLELAESKSQAEPVMAQAPVEALETVKVPAPMDLPVVEEKQSAKSEPALLAVQAPPQPTEPPAPQPIIPIPSQNRAQETWPIPVPVTPMPTVEHRESIKPEEPGPADPEPRAPDRAPLPVVEGDRRIRRLRFMMAACGVAVVVMLTVMVVTHVEEVQRQQTEHELEEFVSHLASTRRTFNAAHRELSVAEANLALKESNLLALTVQARETQRAARNAEEQNTKLAGEQSNFKSRIGALTAERDKAETRVAQWSSLLNDLTNQIQTLSRENVALEARNHRLAQASDAQPVVKNETHAVTNAPAPGNFSLTLSRPASPATPSAADEKQAAAMASPADKLAAPIVPDSDPSSRRSVDILLAHGQCLYSENGGSFQPLVLRQNVHQGAVIKTGKASWCDLIIRRAGTTIRVAPESAIKIAKLSLGTQNGLPVVDTTLELTYGRIFSIVRALVPGSTLEIGDGAGHSVIEGGGLGSYMITAPKPDFGEKLSVVPLRVFTQNGSSVLAPNQEYNAKEGTVFSLTASNWETTLLHLDELEAEADKASAQTETPKPAQ
ncbi:MAG TPA: hypothetical protein VHZ30_03400 [Verrucomicrobiae bacterium]|nr:hypothetical protein [Verrucomicrobiae bacterium]